MKSFLCAGHSASHRLRGYAQRCFLVALVVFRLGAGTAPAELGGSVIPGYTVIGLGRGHYNRLCLAATVEGYQGLMIVDTGAGSILLNENKYRFLLPSADRKLPPGVPATVSINGSKDQVGVAHDFHIAQLDLGTVLVTLVENRYLYDQGMLYVKDSERQYDGLLGENVLRHFNAVVDCGRMGLYLNVDPARKHDFGPAFTRAGWTRIPMDDLSNDFTVPCRISGHSFRIIVDTGAPFTNLDRDLVRSTHLTAQDVPMRGGVVGARATDVAFLDISDFQIGGYTAPRTHTVVSENLRGYFDRSKGTPGDPVIGLLGGNFLADNHAIIDVGDHALFLKAGTTSPAAR